MLKTLVVSCRPAALAVAATGFLALPAQAMVVLDTFEPGNMATGTAWSLLNNQYLAVSFTLNEASMITDVLTSIVATSFGGNGTFSLGIVAGAGLPSGAYLFSTTLINPTSNSSAHGLNWTLDAGAYWLVARPEAMSIGTWQGGNQVGTAWAYTSGGTWVSSGDFDAPAARITATAIPEPGTWAMMLGGLAVCAAAARRQRG